VIDNVKLKFYQKFLTNSKWNENNISGIKVSIILFQKFLKFDQTFIPLFEVGILNGIFLIRVSGYLPQQIS
jgi:hypothetical protein